MKHTKKKISNKPSDYYRPPSPVNSNKSVLIQMYDLSESESQGDIILKDLTRNETYRQTVNSNLRNSSSSYYRCPGYKYKRDRTLKDKVLSLVTLCLWNCSAGCQKLPSPDDN